MMRSMLRQQRIYRCNECGTEIPRWMGRCHGCGAWGTLEMVEGRGPVRVDAGGSSSRGRSRRDGSGRDATHPVDPAAAPGRLLTARTLAEVGGERAALMPTGARELDRVLSGGILAGSVTLLGGEPGVGKSTLLVQALASLSAAERKCLLFTAEESPAQVHVRAERLGALDSGLLVSAARSMPEIFEVIEETSPDVVAVDSIQAVEEPEIGSTPGSVAQVRECAGHLVEMAKSRGIAVVLVGHVTKDGLLAGPRALEHLVDTVLLFEGDRHHALRFLRAAKHRFGSTGELGVFEMLASGLKEVEDPSGLFLNDRRLDAPGSAVVPIMQGKRPMLVEVQALVAPACTEAPRRSVQGIEPKRLELLLAVLEKRAGLSLRAQDVFVSIAGGVRATEPSSDLAVCAALCSAASGRVLPGNVVIFGEVGLAGEVRQVVETKRRLAEALRLGFHSAVAPASSPDPPAGMELRRASTVSEALDPFDLAPEIGVGEPGGFLPAGRQAGVRQAGGRRSGDDVTCVRGYAS